MTKDSEHKLNYRSASPRMTLRQRWLITFNIPLVWIVLPIILLIGAFAWLLNLL